MHQPGRQPACPQLSVGVGWLHLLVSSMTGHPDACRAALDRQGYRGYTSCGVYTKAAAGMSAVKEVLWTTTTGPGLAWM